VNAIAFIPGMTGEFVAAIRRTTLRDVCHAETLLQDVIARQ
jgi:hypothetical protein